MSFANKPSRPDSADVRKLRAEYQKKAQEFRDSGDAATKAKLKDEKAKAFQRVVEQMTHERRANLAEEHKVLARMGKFKTNEQLAREKAESDAAKASRREVQESRRPA
jgi:hypothetical protein